MGLFSSLRLMPCFVVLAALPLPALANGSHDRTQFGREIVVGANDNAGDVTCFGCSVRVRGHVTGDVTTFGGTVIVEQDGQIAGDTTVFGGDLRIDAGSVLQGVTVFGGRFRRGPSAAVQGDITTFGGGAPLWLFIVFGLPFVVLGALIALIAWIVRRFRRPAVPAAARV